MADLALDAVQCVAQDIGNGQKEIDIKNYAKVEKIPGGTIEDCKASDHGACAAARSLLPCVVLSAEWRSQGE